MKKYFESGRSMVEMLGTLAIIGVLSVGGIAGYSYGMDKYRANQTINDIMLMGVDMITQTSQKRGIPTLAEWGTKTTAGYNVTVTSNPDNNTQYGIQITGVPSHVCQMVGDALKNQATVYVGNVERNDTTASDPCESSDENTMKFYFESITTTFGECKTDTDCGNGQYCDTDTGICLRGEKPIGSYGLTCSSEADCGECKGNCEDGQCSGIYHKHGDNCSTPSISEGMCYFGECISKGCDDETPCKGVNEYCASPLSDSTSTCKRFYEGEKGTCVKADFANYTFNGKTYYISYHQMSWWDAEVACKAIGKTMIKADDLLVDWDGGLRYDYIQNSVARQMYEQIFDKGYGSHVWFQEEKSSCDAYRLVFSEQEKGLAEPRSKGTYGIDTFAVCK